jgi:hypothetical protein
MEQKVATLRGKYFAGDACSSAGFIEQVSGSLAKSSSVGDATDMRIVDLQKSR